MGMMSSNCPHLHFARDLGMLLRERARDARLDQQSSVGGEDEDFSRGRLLAFYEVMSLMREQAEAFGMDLEAVGLEGFDPERDLL